MLCTKRLKKDWSSMDASPNLNSARHKWTSQSECLLHKCFDLSLVCCVPGKNLVFNPIVNHTIFGKQKRQTTAGSRYPSARVVNTSGVLSAKIPGYREIPSAILFLRTIGVLLGVTIGMFLGFCSLFERHWQFRCFEVSSYHQSFLLFY